MRTKVTEISRRVGAKRAAPAETPAGVMTVQELVTTVRRLGYVCLRVHEVVMGRLTSQGEYSTAERFNDVFKPLADMLAHFELEDSGGEQEGEPDGV